MERRSTLDRIEIERDGTMFMRLLKQVVDGESIVFSEPHRVPIEPTSAVSAIFDVVNNHLTAMGWPVVPVDDIKRLDAHAKLARTPEVVEAHKVKRAAEARVAKK